MKFFQFKTLLKVVSVLVVFGIILSNKFFPEKYADMRAVITLCFTDQNSKIDTTENLWDTKSFICRPVCLHCSLQQKENLTKLLRNGLVSLTPPSSREEWETLLPLESPLLRHKALEDHLKAGNSTTSSVEIVDGRNTGLREGENLTVMVTIRDGYRRPCQHGGDQIRVWMLNEELKASLATEVHPLGNGSYIAVLPLTLSGKVIVKARLVYNLAVQQAHYYVRHVVGTPKYMGAGFTTLFTEELTLCSPFRKNLGYTKVCNFTEQNGGLPWFCGFPKDETLTCRHWQLNYDFQTVKPLPSTEAEKYWWSVIKQRSGLKRLPLVPSEISVVVDKGDNGRHSKIPQCNAIPIRDTWKTTAPRGYFINETWIPTTCTYTRLSQKQINKCLQNSTVLLLGDSNAMRTFQQLASITGCVKQNDSNRMQWHAPKVCHNDHVVMRWKSHAFPFHVGSHDGVDRTNQQPVHEYIDEVPEDGQFFIMIHLYVHFTAHRDSVFITHLRAVRNSIEKLLRRNPNAKVMIRGPHIFHYTLFSPDGGDIVGPSYTKYIQSEFDGLKDRVLFLQPWDMTVAIENEEMHPPDYVIKAIVEVMLGHIC